MGASSGSEGGGSGGSTCGSCGSELQAGACPACAAGTRLRRLPPLSGIVVPDSAALRVRLVREYKGPTVKDLLSAGERATALLPGCVRVAEKAILARDLEAAEGALDQAVARVLPGPGRRLRSAMTTTLVVALSVALLVSILVLLLAGPE
jgi:hypothetical protein